MNMEDMKKLSLESPSTIVPALISFSSLPYDIVINILARISRFNRPTLSLVSKGFRSLIVSPEIEATRSRMGKTEDNLFVCLKLNKDIYTQWLALARIPQRHKLLPVPNIFPYYQHQESSTVVSMGSEIYLIGGLVYRQRIKRVLVLDCQSHQWRSLPDMIVPRERPAAEVIDGKIYVIGGRINEDNDIEHWGEVYDPKTQTWEPLSPTTLDLTTQKSVVPDRLVMGGKVYGMNGLKLDLKQNICLVEIETNVWCEIFISYNHSKIFWRNANKDSRSWCVYGLEELSPMSYFSTYFVSVANSGGSKVTVWWKTVTNSGGRKVTDWWKTMQYGRQDRVYTKECKQTNIWCAEISFRRIGLRELWGVVEWSKSVFTFNGDCGSDFFLHSAVVKH